MDEPAHVPSRKSIENRTIRTPVPMAVFGEMREYVPHLSELRDTLLELRDVLERDGLDLGVGS